MATKEEIKAFVENGLSVVNGLIEESKYIEASKACVEILEVAPRNREAISFLAKIDKALNKEKGDIFKNNIPKLKELYGAKEYEKAIQVGEQLWVIKQTNQLARIIQKSKAGLKQKQVNELKEYKKKAFKTHKSLTKEHKWLEAIALLEEVLTVDRRNERLKDLIMRDKIKYIDEELHSKVKKALEDQEKYVELYGFFKKLYELFPDHKKLKKEITQTEQKIQKKNRRDKSEFVVKSLEDAEKFFAEKQFEKAIQLTKEILQFTDGESQKAKTLYKKFKKANREDTETLLRKKLSEIIPALEAEFKSHPQGFVRL